MSETNKLIKIIKDPIELFAKWFELAKRKEINDYNAMNLATISQNLKPTSRIVLLKFFDNKGFVFYTNSRSKKGKSIIYNPNVALNFHWKSLLRQVRIEGIVKKISKKESDSYFYSRPYESKIGAWTSNQSSLLKSRKLLKDRFKEICNDAEKLAKLESLQAHSEAISVRKKNYFME